MKGAIIGDVVGSVYEFHNIKTPKFQLLTKNNCFTDDTILTCATADWLLKNEPAVDILVKWGEKYEDRSYENGTVKAFGAGFTNWLKDKLHKPYESNTNGCIMRISPIPLFIKDTKAAIEKALEWTTITHNHPESINAVKAYIETFHLSMQKVEVNEIKEIILEKYGYNLFQPIEEIKKGYNKFYCSCKKSVPEALTCALDSKNYEESIRNAISLGGDSDTLANMAGGIAEARFGTPDKHFDQVKKYLDANILKTIDEFYKKLSSK